MPKASTAQCGTSAGYLRHRRRREKACVPCTDAHSAQGLRWHKAHREQIRQAKKARYTTASAREAYLPYRYGITVDVYDAAAIAQNGVCAACGLVRPCGGNSRLFVDHNHSTKKFRGLLCHFCNTALGLLQEDPECIRALAKYIERFK